MTDIAAQLSSSQARAAFETAQSERATRETRMMKDGAKGAFDPAKARKVAQDFEGFFLAQMLQPMFADIKAEEPFGGGPAGDMWRSLQVDEYGKAVAKAGGIGIADMVYKEMLKAQEAQ